MLQRTFLVVSILAITGTCSGQNPYVNEVYGDGVHAYFRGEIYQAQEQFDRAIQYGSQDPRVYYFRAIVHLQNGDCFQAEQDIRTAVTYELQGRGTYDVGRALARIQGPERLELERMRLLAKLDYSAGQQAVPPPYRAPNLVPSEAPMIPESPFELQDQRPADASDLDLDQVRPQSEQGAPPARAEITESPEVKPDPFADEVQPETPPAEETTPPAAEVAPDENPFDMNADDDPFATGNDDDLQ